MDALCEEAGASRLLHTESFGRQKGAALRLPTSETKQMAERLAVDVDVEPVSLQKAFVYLVGEQGGEGK